MSIIYAVSLAKINCLPQKITHTHTILGEVWNLPHKFHLYLINILALSLWFDQISVSLFATLIKLQSLINQSKKPYTEMKLWYDTLTAKHVHSNQGNLFTGEGDGTD